MAVVLVLVGASQVVFARWWASWSQATAASPSFYMWGLPAILFGVLLLLGVLEGAICLRGLMAVLALLAVGAGALMLAKPSIVQGFLDSMVYERSAGFQGFVVRVAGLLRAVIGLLMVYALLARPKADAESDTPQTVPPRL